MEEFKPLLLISPFLLVVAYQFVKLFITDSSFRYGIYMLLGFWVVGTAWVLAVRAL